MDFFLQYFVLIFNHHQAATKLELLILHYNKYNFNEYEHAFDILMNETLFKTLFFR